jgi:predicted AlkP superfamily pyrophosphatase or phosphodiesterase
MFMLVSSSIHAQTTPKHVVVVGFDGFGAYAIPKANMPHLKEMMRTGAYSTHVRTVLPSSSAVNWASMMMGASPTLHGYTTWGSRTPEIPSAVTTVNGKFPSIFSAIRKQQPQAVIGAVYSWGGIGYLLEKEIIDIDIPTEEDEEETVKQAVNVIKTRKPTFLFVHFDQPDAAGHKQGHDTPAYYEELQRVDTRLAEIQEAIRQAGIEKETLLIVLADHGGIDKGHGGKSLAEVEVPWIMKGPGVIAGKEVKEPVIVYDLAATIAWYLRIKPDDAWRGKAIKSFFETRE